jgi:hypothetical protein
VMSPGWRSRRLTYSSSARLRTQPSETKRIPERSFSSSASARKSLLTTAASTELARGSGGCLRLAALSIEQGGLLAAGEPAKRGLHELRDVADSLRRLGWTGILTVKRESSDRRWRVSWGSRARSIAEKAGVKTLPPVVEEPVEGVLTRS